VDDASDRYDISDRESYKCLQGGRHVPVARSALP
jgi:hypothetical protein